MHTLKTYIVEDSPVIRESLIAALEELGPVKVVGSADGEAGALAWLAQPGAQADLVIVDIFLRQGSGLGLLRAAQALPHGARVVVLSNYATAEMRQRCLQLGAEQVFDKSHEIDDLIAYCGRLAEGTPALAPQTGAA
jgi:DNA-binding NarL/FixJ family response regulator